MQVSGNTITLEAAEDLARGRAVGIDSNGRAHYVGTADAVRAPVGITLEDCVQGNDVSVAVAGVVQAEANEAITAGFQVETNFSQDDGTLLQVDNMNNNNTTLVGCALTAAAAAGQFISVLIQINVTSNES